MTLLSASPGSLRKRAEEDRATKGAALNLLVAERAAARQEAGALGEGLGARCIPAPSGWKGGVLAHGGLGVGGSI